VKRIIHWFPGIAISSLFGLIIACSFAAQKDTMGVIIISHGAPIPEWNQKVMNLIASVKSPYPIEPAFLDYDKERTLEKAVRRLEAKGINNILIVHLSPTSYSNHHEEIRYLVGLRKDLGVYTEMTETPIKSTSRFAVSPGMDEHPLIVAALSEYTRELSQEPTKESLILVGHGPVEEVENIMWIRQLKRIGKEITKTLNFQEVVCMNLRSDAADLVREQAHEDLREAGQRLSKQGRVIVVISSLGTFMLQQEVKNIMKGVPSLAISNKGLMSHPNTVRWIEATIQNGMNQPAVPPINRKWSNLDYDTGKPVGTHRYGLL